ncbi:hypothetical protein H6G41_20980 [Tolypothrix sp. FACHB-123]|uniref:hypothetical protein n=1 Tax=Tolypothrix sp. FACHB-123 TaxID=2692868 RepID=UPI00168550DD|nr:hypothetical protein [Tolypothrix sp. FACHB-123]MBD2357069.1 hypothetical protein [Tolypothrix sp. FACHB-123]
MRYFYPLILWVIGPQAWSLPHIQMSDRVHFSDLIRHLPIKSDRPQKSDRYIFNR